jgi:hypothetical protein
VEDDFLVLGPHQVIDDVGRTRVSTRIAEPLGAD